MFAYIQHSKNFFPSAWKTFRIEGIGLYTPTLHRIILPYSDLFSFPHPSYKNCNFKIALKSL